MVCISISNTYNSAWHIVGALLEVVKWSSLVNMARAVLPSPAFLTALLARFLVPELGLWALASGVLITLFPLHLPSFSSVSSPFVCGSSAWTALCHLQVLVQASPSPVRLLWAPRGAWGRGAVTVELDHRVPPPFMWVLCKYWLSNYWVGPGHAKKGLFSVLFCFVFFHFYSWNPLARERSIYLWPWLLICSHEILAPLVGPLASCPGYQPLARSTSPKVSKESFLRVT